MSSEELWQKKVLHFQEKLYTRLGRKDTQLVLLHLHEVKITGLEAALLSGRVVLQEELFSLYCRALDDLAARDYGFSVLSSYS